jgi:transposase-like protein
MASSISSADITKFDSDPEMTDRTSDENYGDMAVITVKEEALSDDESILNCDSIDDFYEFADTSLPVDGECLELVKGNVIQATNVMPKHGSILVNLLADSTLKSYKQMHRDVETTVNIFSKSILKRNLMGNKNGIEKCKQQPKPTRPFKANGGKALELEPQKFRTIKTQVSQPVEPQLKCLKCSKVFEHKRQLEMHEIDHKQFKSCSNSLPKQEVITVKEEVLSDDEVVMNDASTNQYYNIEGTSLPVNVEYLEMENPNSVHLENNTSNNNLNAIGVSSDSILKNYHAICKDIKSTSGSDSKLVKRHFIAHKDGTMKQETHRADNGSVNTNVKNVMQLQKFKTKPKIAHWYGTSSAERRFKCQECNETFELKSYLLNHELSHERHRKYAYKPPPVVDYVKRSHTTNLAESVNVKVKQVIQQQQHKRKPWIAPSSFAMCYLLNQSYRRKYLSSVKVNKRKVQWQQRLETKPISESTCDTSSKKHRFRCQECSETFELKSCLVMHEISHEWCKRYNLRPALERMKQASATYCVGSVNMTDKNKTAMQQKNIEVKPITEATDETPSVGHRLKCQECSQTFKLKSQLVMHEIAHEQCGRYTKRSQ